MRSPPEAGRARRLPRWFRLFQPARRTRPPAALSTLHPGDSVRPQAPPRHSPTEEVSEKVGSPMTKMALSCVKMPVVTLQIHMAMR